MPSFIGSNLGRAWLCGLLFGALAATPLAGSAPAAHAASDAAAVTASSVRLVDGRLHGALRGLPTREAVERVAGVIGARVRWIVPASDGVADVDVSGLAGEQALARLLRRHSYLLIVGGRPEVHVLAAASPGDGWTTSAPAATASAPERERLVRIAEIDRIAHGDGEPELIGAELAAIARGRDDAAVRLGAAERLLDVDPRQAEGALAWLASDRDQGVRQRAEALLDAARAARAQEEER